ncbi:hypothetical protein ACIG3E_32840 [Streptomyces sp. NPDC053474]|uniref:hypothetical protein n=1 Tax=Streptomyces sp. NPDC053474 TaxID=3365704 RepID=UPI0037CDB5E5
MPEHHHHESAPNHQPPATGNNGTAAPGNDHPMNPAATSAQWRQLLRDEQPPAHLQELPFFRRRRARKAWRTARRDARAQWIKDERRKVPTPVTVPVIALLLAGAVAAASWLWPQSDSDHHTQRAKTPARPTTAPSTQDSAPTPAPAKTPARPRPTTPDGVAKAFVTAYTTRKPLQDGTHNAAVQRAAPFASTALVDNLKTHDDLDFNQLVAAQALTATPVKVTIKEPTAKDKLAPDTSVRVYRPATARIQVKGTDNYHYTRHLTIEVSRADAGQPWMVTRVLGVQE